MDALLQTLTEAQALLDRAGIRNALIGGLAMVVWGQPRVTKDVDLKVEAERADLDQLMQTLAPSFLPVPNALEVARRLGVLFLDSSAGVRLDLLLCELGFDRQALDRAVEVEIQPAVRARLCTAEDIVIYKLLTNRAIDFEDVRRIVREQGDKLDRAYIEKTLRDFELALDDSGLVENFRSLR